MIRVESDSCALIIPTLNAGSSFCDFLEAIRLQTFQPNKLILLDSESVDETVVLGQEADFETHTILRREFDHGGTRQQGVLLAGDVDIYIFLTQDAILASPDALDCLVASFSDQRVGAVCGRQLPHKDASSIAAHARIFNYPCTSKVKSINDARELGIKTAFISNSFAAYRRTALEEVGGFPAGTLFGEDTIVAARMLKAGWKIAYCAEAACYHSHNYSMKEEFKRYFDIGAFHSMESWFIDSLGNPEGEGKKFVISELRYLARKAPWLIPAAFVRTALKFTGYKLGCQAQIMPLWMKRSLSMNRGFWKNEEQ